MNHDRIWVLIPAFNEASTIGTALDDLRQQGFTNLIVVDDGSTDDTAALAKEHNVIVVSHPINCGVGAALSTGFDYLKKYSIDRIEAVVTVDGDGQHLAQDAVKVVAPILNHQADCVLGSRLLEKKNKMPIFRQLGNQFLNLLIWIFYKVRTTDSQSGLRAFSPKALDKIELKSTGFAALSECFREISAHQLQFKEVPVSSIYTPYSQSKGQNISQALNTIRSFLLNQ